MLQMMSRNIIAVLIGAFLLLLVLGLIITRGFVSRVFQVLPTPVPGAPALSLITPSPIPCAGGYVAYPAPNGNTTYCNPNAAAGSAVVNQLTIPLAELGASGISGTATIIPSGSGVIVTINISQAQNITRPAHIHQGSCPAVGQILYPLNSVVNGTSVTYLNTTIDKLLTQLPLALNIHRSESEINIYVACGNLPSG